MCCAVHHPLPGHTCPFWPTAHKHGWQTRAAWLHLLAVLYTARSPQAVEAKASAADSLAGQQVGYLQRLPVHSRTF